VQALVLPLGQSKALSMVQGLLRVTSQIEHRALRLALELVLSSEALWEAFCPPQSAKKPTL
jgi:hypothetical protein